MAKRGRRQKEEGEMNRVRQEFYLDPEQVDYLNAIAEKTNISKAEVVRSALDEWMKGHPWELYLSKRG